MHLINHLLISISNKELILNIRIFLKINLIQILGGHPDIPGKRPILHCERTKCSVVWHGEYLLSVRTAKGIIFCFFLSERKVKPLTKLFNLTPIKYSLPLS